MKNLMYCVLLISSIINDYFYHDDELIDYSINDIVLFGSYYW